MSMQAFLALLVVLFLGVVACADEPQHTIRVNVEVKPVRQPGPFARLFARRPAPAPMVMVPLQAIPDMAKLATLTTLVSGVPAVPTPPAAKVKVPTVEVRVNK